MTAWYNEIDRQKAAWLRHLIEEGVIAHGVVDERPIQAVQPEDLAGFVQCHFFAGVGVWSYAARLAGWPDDRPLWTGSCPCGPFSRAGLQKGFEDPRHLWPTWFPIIRECRPDCVFGEQSADADLWIDLVSTDLESIGYAFGSPDLPAAGFGGAHERQRFDWVADANNAEWWSERAPWHDGHWPKTGRVQGNSDAGNGRSDCGMADAAGVGWGQECADDGRRFSRDRAQRITAGLAIHGHDFRLGDAYSAGLSDTVFAISRRKGLVGEGRESWQPGDPRRPGADWLLCRDGAYRPVEPGTCPLVDEAPARMGRLRGYGDCVDAEQTAQFIAAYLASAPTRSEAA